ncbi:hypothetical protein AMAG_03013 [Allomyces macrogynus ATCC 38327]|uniref:Uncharacterized protein n=1 Tax=Allomyces macrogynus (strain ATCC 38327) TaxID=578462 RepID=A0A0L0S4F3_ALLM3|nr:hypothetical protein AMAG_03013 [Allomyces macrogynus ATCC 38327]|eukprot:KNE57281.1 hypothetical protein AMAG_03013 [Allomyces macrogynus ATCC 38327]
MASRDDTPTTARNTASTTTPPATPRRAVFEPVNRGAREPALHDDASTDPALHAVPTPPDTPARRTDRGSSNMPHARARNDGADDASTRHEPITEPNSAPEADADLPDWAACPICHAALIDAMTTPCAHTFCGPCLAQWMFGSPALPANWDRVGGGGDAAALVDRAMPCAMCRQPVAWSDLTPRADLVARVRERFGAQVKARMSDPEVQVWATRRQVTVRFAIGNRHMYVIENMLANRSNVHLWTFYVHADPPHLDAVLIDRVVVHLHPTFRPASVTLTAPPFELKRLGWGIFNIACEIYWKPSIQTPANPTVAEWLLDFTDDGSATHFDVPFLIPRADDQNDDDTASALALHPTPPRPAPAPALNPTSHVDVPQEDPPTVPTLLTRPRSPPTEFDDEDSVAALPPPVSGTSTPAHQPRQRLRTTDSNWSIFSDPLSEAERVEVGRSLDEELHELGITGDEDVEEEPDGVEEAPAWVAGWAAASAAAGGIGGIGGGGEGGVEREE